MKHLGSQKKTSGKVNRIAGYVRSATCTQVEGLNEAMLLQRLKIETAILRKNMKTEFGNLVHIFTDEKKSGLSIERPGLSTLLASIQRHEIDLVVVTDISRLARDPDHIYTLIGIFKTHDCALWDLSDQHIEKKLVTVRSIAFQHALFVPSN